MKFSEAEVITRYEDSRTIARKKLSSLTVAEGRVPALTGLNAWVFEQTIRYCLSHELGAVGLRPQMQDQVRLEGRAKIDLLVGKVAIELKAGGSFGAGDLKYVDYRKIVMGRGWVYIYLTLVEDHAPYRRSTKATFGAGLAFFLDTKGDWKRFVNAVMEKHA